jgi:pSer/pThr/pTyr-binding forkhead associated (FHA) protein
VSDTILQLVVTKGPCSGLSIPVTGGTVSIGRDPHADLVLTGDQFVSSEHAKVTAGEHGVVLKNLSPNGTLVNGKPVVESPLADGDTIAVGVAHLIRVRVMPADEIPVPRQPAVPEVRVAAAPAPAMVRPGPARSQTRPPVILPPARVPAGPAPSTPAKKAAPPNAVAAGNPWTRMPMWLRAYLVLILVAFVVFGALKATAAKPAGLIEISAQERRFSAALKLPAADTDRLLALLDTAVVHERRGDRRSAYEAYREVLGFRQPIDPRSPAYRYAAARMAALGSK